MKLRKWIGLLLIVISIAGLIAFHLPGVERLRNFPVNTLMQESKSLQFTVDATSLSGVSESGVRRNDMIKQRVYYEIEIFRRTFDLEWLLIVLFVMGVGLIILSFMSFKQISRKVYKARVQEMPPNEVYVDDLEFYRRSQDAFTSRDEALHWYETDLMRVCSYCGAEAVVPVKGKLNQLQVTTFYKKVPDGAQDQRIVMGSAWFVYPARELECGNCGQKIIR